MKISTLIAIYFTVIFASVVMLKIYEKYTKKQLKIDKSNIIKVLIISILFLLNNVYMLNIAKIILASIITFILYIIIFKDNIKNTLYNTLLISVSLHILDLLLAIFLPMWIKNVEILNQSMIFKVGYSILVNLILYFIMTNKFIVSFFNKIKDTSRNNILFYTTGVIGLIICNIWSFYLANDTANKTLNLILGITEIIILICAIIILKNKYEKNLSLIKEEQLKQNLDLYSKVASEYKELKHNLMNDLLIIKTKVKKSDQEFINDIINKYKSNYEWVNCITDIPEGLQGLVFLKKNQAEMKNITFNLEYNVNKNIEKLFSLNKNFKLYETLGILFDNAIEGAAESKEKVINVVFSYDKKVLHINILNTFNNQIDLDEIGNKHYSTKNRGSGIGLNYLKKQKNKFEVNQFIRENIFITEITINSKEKK